MNLRRAFVCVMMITLIMLLLAAQLFLLQIVQYDRYSARRLDLTARSVMQRARGIVLDDGRGRILDRAGRPMTGFPIHALGVEPSKAVPWLDSHKEIRGELLRILQLSADDWDTAVDHSVGLVLMEKDGRPIALSREQTEAITQFNIPGLSIVPYVRRYQQPYIAAHAIGYISQDPERLKQLYAEKLADGSIQLHTQLGASGLERAFEKVLHSRGQLTLNRFTDAVGRPLSGLDRRLITRGGSMYPLQVVTTLDFALQRRIEQLLEDKGIAEASVVLLDAANADVLVMANRPTYNPEHPDPYSHEWRNLAIQQQVPGSIFKLVVAAAALEYGVVSPRENFVCNGEYGKYGFSCWKKGGHGHLTMEEAFAVSCNLTFAELAKRITPEQLQHMALKLGIGRTIGWEGQSQAAASGLLRQFDLEQAGQVFAAGVHIDEGVMLQTAIGQRDVRMTPLAAANLLVTLLNGGSLTSPRIVSEVRYKDGAVKERYPVRRFKDEGVSRSTAYKLTRYMRKTVQYGTASMMNDHEWHLAGKTGTAQLASRDHRVNEWFIGYGPAEKPLVAAAIVIYNVPDDGRNQAARLFTEVMDIVREAREQG